MSTEDILQQRQTRLIELVRSSFQRGSQHSRAFARRVLGAVQPIHADALVPAGSAMTPQDTAYYGIPAVASLGFQLGAGKVTDEEVQSFLAGLKRLQHRPESGLATLVGDDVALLGVADGLANIVQGGHPQYGDACAWLTRLIDTSQGVEEWTSRLRYLAGDLLDGRGRLFSLPSTANPDVLALDLALRRVWPQAYIRVPTFDPQTRASLLHHLLTEPSPHTGDLERATIHLAAIDSLVSAYCISLIPSVSETVRLLTSIQHSLKRWRWAAKSRRRVAPSRWLIDDEYDVQALLWAVLYPIYQADLVDETYLPAWGNVQPRVDLGITSLKLIIEVKIAREPSDFKKIEEQVAGDEGLYFKDTSQFDRMLVFVYDDSDKPQPERYESLRNALVKRERIEDVIIVQRPSMIPKRDERGERNAGQEP